MLRNFMNGLMRTWFTGDELDKLDLSSLKEGESPKKGANEGKVAIVTGGTTGLGKATTWALARAGYSVTFTGRNVEAGEEMVEQAQVEGLHLTFKQVDFLSLESVRAFASQFTETHPGGFHLLVNNAGVCRGVHEVSKDGFETMLQTNCLGPLYLTRLLLPLLEAVGDGRIIFVSSDGHWSEKLDLEDLNGFRYRKVPAAADPDHIKPYTMEIYDGFELYSNTKMLNILLARKLLRELQQKGSTIPVYTLHPGEVSTSLAREDAIPGVKQIMRMFFRSAENGARTQIYLSLAPKERLEAGGYYVACAVGYCSPRCSDLELQDQAWLKVGDLLKRFPGSVAKSLQSDD